MSSIEGRHAPRLPLTAPLPTPPRSQSSPSQFVASDAGLRLPRSGRCGFQAARFRITDREGPTWAITRSALARVTAGASQTADRLRCLSGLPSEVSGRMTARLLPATGALYIR